MKRVIKHRVMLNGEEITSDVCRIAVEANPQSLLFATVDLYCNDITKDDEGNLVYWLGSKALVDIDRTCEVPGCNLIQEHEHCPVPACLKTQPHVHPICEEPHTTVAEEDACEERRLS